MVPFKKLSLACGWCFVCAGDGAAAAADEDDEEDMARPHVGQVTTALLTPSLASPTCLGEALCMVAVLSLAVGLVERWDDTRLVLGVRG